MFLSELINEIFSRQRTYIESTNIEYKMFYVPILNMHAVDKRFEW